MISQPSELTSLSSALESAIVDLEQIAKQSTPHPSRFHARDILIPLGSLLAADLPFPVEAITDRLKKLTAPFAENWERALAEEMQLATAEYVTSVDPRYLEMDGYDFNYTTAARERLEARLLACECLGHTNPELLGKQIEKADETYRPFRERYEAEQA